MPRTVATTAAGGWRAAVAVGALAAGALALLSTPLRHEARPRGDDLIYERMAQHPLGTHTFPFGYRIGVPWLVHVLPFGHTAGFLLVAFLSAGGAAAFTYLLMLRMGAGPRLAAALALALALSPPLLIEALRDGRNTDAATVMVMAAGVFFAVERRPVALAVTLTLGVAVRESELFVIPLVYALWARSWWDPRALARTTAVSAGAVAAYVALHLGIDTVGRAQVPGYGGSIVGERFHVLRLGFRSLPTELRRLFTVYGPLWLVAPLALRFLPFARRGLVLVAASVAAMTFALDWGRMILLSAPVFYPSAAAVLERRRRWQAPVLAAFALLIVGYGVYMTAHGVVSGIDRNPPPPYPVR